MFLNTSNRRNTTTNKNTTLNFGPSRFKPRVPHATVPTRRHVTEPLVSDGGSSSRKTLMIMAAVIGVICLLILLAALIGSFVQKCRNTSSNKNRKLKGARGPKNRGSSSTGGNVDSSLEASEEVPKAPKVPKVPKVPKKRNRVPVTPRRPSTKGTLSPVTSAPLDTRSLPAKMATLGFGKLDSQINLNIDMNEPSSSDMDKPSSGSAIVLPRGSRKRALSKDPKPKKKSRK